MNMDYWCDFSVLARIGSFSEAAVELNISQSTLSKHILALEKELDIKLFDRTSRQVFLSEAGRELLEHAEQVQELRRKIYSIAYEYSRADKPTVKLVSIPVLRQYGIMELVDAFKAEFSETRFLITECDRQEVLRIMNSKPSSIGFCRDFDVNPAVMDAVALCRDALAVVLPKDHPLKNAEQISVQDLAQESFATLGQWTGILGLLRNSCLSAGYIPNVVYEANSPHEVIQAVSAGSSIGVLPEKLLNVQLPHHICIRKLYPATESTLYMVKSKTAKLPEAAARFWAYTAKQAPQLPAHTVPSASSLFWNK